MTTDTSLDPLAILAALGVTDARTAVPVSGGWDTSIWRVERAEGVSALRVFRAGEEETCRREVEVMRAAVAAGLPVPAVHAAGIWRDRAAMLLSWCEGRPLRDEIGARPWRAVSLGTEFGRMQARIHAVAAPSVLRADADHHWIAWSGPDEALLQARLRALTGEAGALIHLDYHALNVMADGRRVTGVLDWTNARAGDPRADLARTLTILRLSPIRPGAPRRKPLLLRRLLELGWRRGYRQAAGWPREMPLFYAWAGAVMAGDLAEKIGRPGIWLQPHHLEHVRRWTKHWKQRPGYNGWGGVGR